jgi:hypothetical protein
MGVAPGSYDANARTSKRCCRPRPRSRYYFTEELEISADAVDLGRAAKGMCPLLDAHKQRDIAAVSARFECPHRRRPTGRHADIRRNRRRPKPKAWSPAAN